MYYLTSITLSKSLRFAAPCQPVSSIARWFIPSGLYLCKAQIHLTTVQGPFSVLSFDFAYFFDWT